MESMILFTKSMNKMKTLKLLRTGDNPISNPKINITMSEDNNYNNGEKK